jgi:phosphosulfolactate phosphohydrolase-like enzyme
VIALDGKTLKRSFDHLNDRAAAHVLSAFACEAALILAHQEVRDAPEEIPAAQALIEALGVRGVLFTADALHGQKKLRERRPHRQRPSGPAQGQPAELA